MLQALRFREEFGSPAKRFFFSTSDFVFSPLPDLLINQRERIEGFQGPFTGNPENVLFKTEPAPEQETKKEEEDSLELTLSSDDETVTKQIIIKEVERLAFVVKAIDHECAAVPLGSFKLLPSNQVRRNSNFYSLSLEESLDLKNWFLLRDCDKEISYLDDSGQMNFVFLESVAEQPKSWRAQTDLERKIALVRNEFWPGFQSFLFIKEGIAGYCYFGQGLQQSDLYL